MAPGGRHDLHSLVDQRAVLRFQRLQADDDTLGGTPVEIHARKIPRYADRNGAEPPVVGREPGRLRFNYADGQVDRIVDIKSRVVTDAEPSPFSHQVKRRAKAHAASHPLR